MQCQINGGVNGSHLFGTLCKSTGKDEYPDHKQDVLIGGTYRKLINPLIQFKPSSNSDSITGRNKESYGDRYFIKVINQNGSYQIKAEKYEQRAKCPPTAGTVLMNFFFSHN